MAVVLGTSCSTGKKVQKTESFGKVSNEGFIQKVIDNTPSWPVFSARTSISLYSAGGKRARVKGVLSIKRDEMVRLTVAPLLGIEFFRLEISPAHILVVDRINKRYMKCTMEEISEMVNVDVTYNMFQSLFLNELFASDVHRQLQVADSRKFRAHQSPENMVIEPVRNKGINTMFYTNADNGQLERTTMAVRQYKLNWDYDDFSAIGLKNFPHTMRITSEGLASAPSVNLDFSNISTDGKWNADTRISSRYKEVKLAELVNMFLKK